MPSDHVPLPRRKIAVSSKSMAFRPMVHVSSISTEVSSNDIKRALSPYATVPARSIAMYARSTLSRLSSFSAAFAQNHSMLFHMRAFSPLLK